MLKMEEDWNGQMGIQNRSSGLNSPEALAEKKVAELAVNSGSMFNSSHEGTIGSCYGSGWDPIVSLGQSENFEASLMASHGNFPLYPENTVLRATSQFTHHFSSDDANAVEMLPKQSVFGGDGSFSELMHPYGCAQKNSGALNKSIMIKKASMDQIQSREECQLPKEASLGASPNGKRKRNAERELQRGASDDISDQKELEDRKQKIEENVSSDERNKQIGGQTKDNSLDGEGSKENYVHIRARKGQATNSHSLAERVRREKINDRMKLLQELVPGCNKITGKAVMLDEIINYVQSLQQQVEFLSMKLATVNPELNFNIEQILSEDMCHSRGNSAPILGLTAGMGSSHLCTTDIHQGAFSGIASTASPYHSASQGMWDGELQNLLHMGFESNPPINNLGPNGNSER